MINKVKDFIKKNNLLMDGDSVILGVSGGADSVCLLFILYELSKSMSLKLTVVHINHGIRGEDAQSDYLHVEKLCNELSVEFIGFYYDVTSLAKKEKLSIEEAGRKVRYETFEQVFNMINADKIAVAHNRNDNAETILLNLFRGSGINGIAGIRPSRGNVIRPLLFLDRSEIEEFLNNRDIKYKTDVTNSDVKYMRNKIRLKMLPLAVNSVNDQAVSHIINLSEQLCEVEEYLEIETDRIYNLLVKHREFGKELYCTDFENLNIVIKKRIIRKVIGELAGKLKDITKIHINDTLELFNKTVGKQISLPYGLFARRTYDSVILYYKNGMSENESYEIEITKEGKYLLPNGSMCFTIRNVSENMEEITENLYTKYFDYDKIKGNLFLRNRIEADFLTFDSANHIKKLKAFFIDNKVPKEERSKILLLAEGSHILWVVGYRISNAYKVTEKTTRVLEVHFDGGCNAE